ncbi:hypothetical protein A2U01_0109740, partial [Trifolium medium]|nr:hypothetical protein [Trifolium medium]
RAYVARPGDRPIWPGGGSASAASAGAGDVDGDDGDGGDDYAMSD